jgi:hypothetical protein
MWQSISQKYFQPPAGKTSSLLAKETPVSRMKYPAAIASAPPPPIPAKKPERRTAP